MTIMKEEDYMNILTATDIVKNYTGKTLLDEVSFGLDDSDKVGIIGINGTGKSTLLKIIAGATEPDAGKIVMANNLKISYLEQNPVLDDSKNVLENVLSVIENGVSQVNWSLEGEAKSILNRMGFDNYSENVANMSGGQKKRIALVRAILTKADMLILDEPTNHLDAAMAGWLEDYLKKYRGAIIMVTHDRYFLDQVTDRILEIDDGKIYSYDTNYEGFLELKAAREEMVLATERKNRSLYRTELEWMMRGARARSTKQKAHIQRFENLRDRQKPVEKEQLKMASVSSRLGKKTIELSNICKGFDDKKLISDFTYIFLRDDRIGIVGRNGCGKSTLLKIIMGYENADSGSVDIGTTVKIGYFSQMNEYLDESMRVIDYVKETAEYIETPEGRITASVMCERFLFTSQLQYSLIGKLSGGEKRRLYLLHVLMQQPNVLILDEPTNDLDIKTMTILEDYLDSFDGIVIAVSHDRFFLDRVAKRLFVFDGTNLRQFEGGYSDLVAAGGYDTAYDIAGGSSSKTTQSDESTTKTAKDKSSWKQKGPKLKLTYNEQREYDTIEDDIAKLEEKISECDEMMVKNATDSGKLNDLLKEKTKLEEQLDEKMERYVYLTDQLEEIEKNKKLKNESMR